MKLLNIFFRLMQTFKTHRIYVYDVLSLVIARSIKSAVLLVPHLYGRRVHAYHFLFGGISE